MREILFGAGLAAAAALVSLGVGAIHRPAGLIVGGALFGAWVWLVLGEVGE